MSSSLVLDKLSKYIGLFITAKSFSSNSPILTPFMLSVLFSSNLSLNLDLSNEFKPPDVKGILTVVLLL